MFPQTPLVFDADELEQIGIEMHIMNMTLVLTGSK